MKEMILVSGHRVSIVFLIIVECRGAIGHRSGPLLAKVSPILGQVNEKLGQVGAKARSGKPNSRSGKLKVRSGWGQS